MVFSKAQSASGLMGAELGVREANGSTICSAEESGLIALLCGVAAALPLSLSAVAVAVVNEQARRAHKDRTVRECGVIKIEIKIAAMANRFSAADFESRTFITRFPARHKTGLYVDSC